MFAPKISPKVAAVAFGLAIVTLLAIRSYTHAAHDSESRGPSAVTYALWTTIAAAVIAASVAMMREQGSTASPNMSMDGFKVALNDFRESTSNAYMKYYKPRMYSMKKL